VQLASIRLWLRVNEYMALVRAIRAILTAFGITCVVVPVLPPRIRTLPVIYSLFVRAYRLTALKQHFESIYEARGQ
jgi:hypothetical protein